MSSLLNFLTSYTIPTVFGTVPLSKFTIQFTKFVFGAHLFWEYFAQVKQTSGPSMLPTLNAYGDWVLVSKLYRRGKGVEVGDLVSVKHPMFPGMRIMKRVLGMPGDFVLRDTPGRSDMMIQVPEGHCWLAGDNMSASRDSREYGPLPLALVRGKVLAKVLPLSEARWIENPLKPVKG